MVAATGLVESGSATFCVRCQKLFRLWLDDEEGDGGPTCPDCAQEARLMDVVRFTADDESPSQMRSPLGSILSRVIARTPGSAAADDAVADASSSIGGTGHPTTDVPEAERDEGVNALQKLIINLRRENNGLRQRLHSALNEAAEAEFAAVEGPRHPPSASSSPSPMGSTTTTTLTPAAASGGGSGSSSSGPTAELNALLDALIPLQLRRTARYKPLNDRLDELGEEWAARERRLSALQAALLLAEATTVTLQEELLVVETSEVTLGQLVKAQQAEIRQLHAALQAATDEVGLKEKAAQLAGVRRAEAEAMLQLRHDSDQTLRAQAREMQRSLADAHTSLDSFVSVQQTRRAKELEQRQRLLAEWDAKLRSSLQAARGSSGGGGVRRYAWVTM